MRSLFLSPLLFVLSVPCFAQEGAGTAAKPDAPADPASYLIGANVALGLKRQGVEVDLDSFLAGMRETFSNAETRYSDAEAREIMAKFEETLMERARQKGIRNLEDGRAFLEKNGKRPEVKTTASGLQYEVIKEGKGARPTANDRVKVHYHGTLIDGSVFDSSVKRGEPFETVLGQVIKGWTEGVQLMTVGSKYKFFIPSELAYGAGPAGPGGPNSTLIFEVELLDIVSDE